MSAGSQHKKSSGKPLAANRKASFNFLLLEKFEAGIQLTGAEVKSIRAGNVSLNECFARIDGGELYIHGMHVQPYSHSPVESHNPIRTRKLLLHKREITKLIGQVAEKGRTIVPVKLYLTKRGFIKMEIALGKGKQMADKRESIKKRTADREMAREVANRRKQ